MTSLSEEQKNMIKDIIHNGIKDIKIHRIDQSNMILDIDYDNIVEQICGVING